MGVAAAPIAIAMTVMSTAAAAAGQIQAGRAAKAQADYQSQVARNNEIIAERKAQDAIERGEVDERQQRIRTQQLIGSQRAGAAARGVVVDEGSAADLTQDTAAIGELDALTIRSNAAREAMGFRTEGMNFQAEGQLAKMRGKQAKAGSIFGAAGTVLGGGGTVANKWHTFYGG